MSSFRQRWVKTSVLRNQTAANTSPRLFQTGTGLRSGQSAGASVDSNGVLFFALVNSDSLVCWNTKNPYEPRFIGELAKNDRDMQFIATVMVSCANNLKLVRDR
jgi:hypothetical protein